MSPPSLSKADSQHSRLKPTPKEGLPHISSPRTHRQAHALHKDNGDKERDKTPGTTQEVIYFWLGELAWASIKKMFIFITCNVNSDTQFAI